MEVTDVHVTVIDVTLVSTTVDDGVSVCVLENEASADLLGVTVDVAENVLVDC